jgi:hypothetical protein
VRNGQLHTHVVEARAAIGYAVRPGGDSLAPPMQGVVGASNRPDTSDGTDAPPADQEEPDAPSPSPGKGRRLNGHARP